MSKFSYTATGDDGKQHTGTIEAANDAAARSAILRLKLKPILIKKAVKKKGFNMEIGFLTTTRVKNRDLVIFTRQLATMINAGVPLVRSLATMQNQTESDSLKIHLKAISKDVESGTSFADTLEKHGEVFGPIYINMVRAGEAGGILDEILKKLAVQQEKDATLRGKFKSAMTYPVVLVGITAVVFISLMTFVVPQIGTIVSDLSGGELPTMTKILLSVSDFMITYWWLELGILFGGGFYLIKFLRTQRGRGVRDRVLLKIPGIKTIIIKMAVARFSRIFASLMTAGVSVIDSIEITAKAIGNTVIEKELHEAAKQVANGVPFSVPLSKSEIFPPIVSQMLAIGEETGQVDSVLVKVADFYEEEVDAAAESLSSILEPLMIVVMGVMVGVIAASVLGPISSLSQNI